jgi:hypothetical protein
MLTKQQQSRKQPIHYIDWQLYCPAQGDIVGREYIKVCKFLMPYGISLRDSTIVGQQCGVPRVILQVFIIIVFKNVFQNPQKKFHRKSVFLPNT